LQKFWEQKDTIIGFSVCKCKPYESKKIHHVIILLFFTTFLFNHNKNKHLKIILGNCMTAQNVFQKHKWNAIVTILGAHVHSRWRFAFLHVEKSLNRQEQQYHQRNHLKKYKIPPLIWLTFWSTKKSDPHFDL